VAEFRPGVRIQLRVPENPRLDGAYAVVETVAAWGCHVLTAAAATGRFRALFSEMTPDAPGSPSGDFCDRCGSARVRRCGTCLVCENCGTTSGCS
jgi:hypothetical protein